VGAVPVGAPKLALLPYVTATGHWLIGRFQRMS
jgi:hypothetical protein